MLKKITQIAIFVAAACVVFGARQTTMLPGTVKNFELPHFDEKSGAKEWELFGTAATYVNDSRIDIENIKLNLHEKKGDSAKIRATIKSPSAKVNPNTKISESSDDISVNATEFDMLGKVWKWNGDKRFVEVFSNVKITVKPRNKDDKPTLLTSQYASLLYHGDENIFELQKNVSTKNDEMSLDCQYLRAKTPKKGSGLSEILAKGAVKMTRDGKETFSEKAEIDSAKGLAILTGNPKIIDIASHSELLGARVELHKKEKKIDVFSDKGRRASTIIYHTEEGKSQKITILANKIEMSQKGEENIFDFIGNVKIVADDFTANCDNMQALSKSKDEKKNKLEYIRGSGNVRFENEDGIATSKSMEILPEKGEIWLADNASLKNPQRGVSLSSDIMVFFRNQNKGLALSNAKDKNAFVTVKIIDSSSIKNVTAIPISAKKGSTIKSKKLTFTRSEKAMNFAFEKDVSINSDDVSAVCQNMVVYAEVDENGSANAKKIVATDNVSISQKSYTATSEVATIYLNLAKNEQKRDPKKINTVVELTMNPQNPLLRPTVTLPPLGDIGITDAEIAPKKSKTPTVIKSDKQWLTSSIEVDRYFFQGDVTIDATDMKSTCDKIETIMRAKKINAQKEITQIIMTGNVHLDQNLKEIHCGRADIYADEQMAVLSDNPVVIDREDNSRASGHRIVYNKGTRTIAVESDPNVELKNREQQEILPPSIEDEEKIENRPTIRLPLKRRK